MLSLILVAADGAVGAACRYGAGLFFTVFFGGVFPLGTLFVNVAGCFIIGAMFSALASHVHGALGMFLIQGFCGALTTFSTFSLESFRLLHEGRLLRALLNIALNIILGLCAVLLGMFLFA